MVLKTLEVAERENERWAIVRLLTTDSIGGVSIEYDEQGAFDRYRRAIDIATDVGDGAGALLAAGAVRREAHRSNNG